MTWEDALETFIAPYRNNPDVQAALLTGSRATGTANVRSDIDVYMILAEGLGWRERGIRRVGGFLVEYFLNPPGQIRKYMESDLAENSCCESGILKKSRVIFDHTGIATELKAQAAALVWPRPSLPSGIPLEMAKYYIWDLMDEVERAHGEDGGEFAFLASLLVEKLILDHARCTGAVVPRLSKIRRLLADQDYARQEGFAGLGDSRFEGLLRVCLDGAGRGWELEDLRSLGNYVLDRLGGFDPDGWKIRSPAEG